MKSIIAHTTLWSSNSSEWLALLLAGGIFRRWRRG